MEIFKYFLYVFIAFLTPYFLAKGVWGLIQNRGKYTFKVIWHSSAHLFGVTVLIIVFIKLIFMKWY
ncbi:hypothetical protein NEPTK9_000220 [Candidatus Neptunochlamydia vexilliferae]|uniref:Uncharacterized protein n=1 Tax=Candidatus Neptunichlamydia vexilliferae TaxID=1651774 RepID=A0ABS0AX70_9BACT|nr:hypothetical protein [Candidatus Neptunochlamydia vexilliferae]